MKFNFLNVSNFKATCTNSNICLIELTVHYKTSHRILSYYLILIKVINSLDTAGIPKLTHPKLLQLDGNAFINMYLFMCKHIYNNYHSFESIPLIISKYSISV